MRSLASMGVSFVLALTGAGIAADVLHEDFELPDTANFTTFFAGESMVTASNTWLIASGSVDLFEDAARPEAAAYDLGQAVDVTGSPGAGVIETTFATLPGEAYSLVIHYARNSILGAIPAAAQVDVLGADTLLSATLEHALADHPFDEYVEFQAEFEADSDTAVLRLTSLNEGVAGMTVDGITITPVPVCDADCNDDGAVNIFDFLCFQGLVTQGDMAADCNGDCVLNIFDFLCFQGAVTQGCM